MTKWECQHGDPWPSLTINTGTHDRVRISTGGYVNKYKYQHHNTWPSMNIKIGTHEQVSMATQRNMTKCEYQHSDTWASVNFDTAIHDQLWISVIFTCDTCPSENNKMGKHNPVRITTLWYISKCEYQHYNTCPSVYINMEIYVQVSRATWV